ncbi:MAG: protein kinase [Gemmataceae bacterium]|nr:protein kinase [Gemmataceae bacterium]
MTATPCPLQPRLLAFSSGDLPAADLDAVAEHILTCAACQNTLESSAPSADPVVAGVKLAARLDPFVQEAQCRHAVAQVQALTPAAATASPVLAQLGQYQLLHPVGRGGMGVVYKALHPFLKREVVLKVLPPERLRKPQAVARFRREMEAVGKLQHPNIVQATDAGESDGQHFLVMEHVEGCDLARLVRKRGPLPVADACEAIRQAALGLQHAHEHGLVHRDIKPSNLLVTPAGQVKVLDLGLALLRGEMAEGELTEVGQIMGTLDYMAPEQAFDAHCVDGRADVYSLGCTLFFLLAGRPPYDGSEYRQALKKMLAHAGGPIPALPPLRPDAPAGLEAVLQRLLAKKPADRFATPADVATALAPFCAGHDLPVLLRSEDSPPDTARVARTADALLTARVSPAPSGRRPEGSGEATPAGQPAASSRGRPSVPRRVLPWLGAAAAGLLGALWVAGVIFRVQTPAGTLVIEVDQPGAAVFLNNRKYELKIPGGEPITVEVDEGKHELKVTKGGFETFTKQFAVRAGGKETVKVRLEPLAAAGKHQPPPAADPERTAVEWVLKQGGTVGLADRRVWKQVTDLPGGSLRPVGISLPHRSTQNGIVGTVLTDHDLEQLRALPDSVRVLDLRGHAYTDAGIDRLTGSPFAARLAMLHLASPNLTDAGFDHLPRCQGLTTLHLRWLGPHFTGAGLKNLRRLPHLRELGISYTWVRDEGLAHLAGLKLHHLGLRGCVEISNEGLKAVGRLPELQALGLYGVERVSDAGVNHLRGLKQLHLLDLAHTRLGDEGLKPLANLSNLRTLYLGNTRVTDAGVDTLARMKTLTVLSVNGTQITSAGVEKLRKALPRCKIVHE